MDLNKFILQFLNREESFFTKDLSTNYSELSARIKDKNMLVIGGAGTIGFSYIKAALKFHPAKLVVVDINENGLTELVRDLRSTPGQFVPNEFYTYPLSFDNPIFAKLFKAHGPFQIVTNFAAHKHVRSEKDIYSIEALLENNVIGAKKLLDLMLQCPPEHFFCVSTDKAANPVNIMGASKKMMEEMILAYSRYFKVTTARFANVAFSNGSLLDGFLQRVKKKQPLSCPSDVKRFFVAPVEAGEICLLACILGNTGEVFFPKMNFETDQIQFMEIITPFLAEFGYEPLICFSEKEAKENVNLIDNGKYPVYLFETDTSGEKLYEEFYTDGEKYDLNRYHSLGVIAKELTHDVETFGSVMKNLENLLLKADNTKEDIVKWLTTFIPEFGHIETGKKLDNKM